MTSDRVTFYLHILIILKRKRNEKIVNILDDIQLVPRYSQIPSRNDIKLHTLLSRRYGLLNPIVASPMDTVCELEMAYKMFKLGGVGCIHRFNSIQEQSNIVKQLYEKIFSSDVVPKEPWEVGCGIPPIMSGIGVSEDDKESKIN